MVAGISELLSTLALETLETDLFRGRSPDIGWQRVFGGQVVAQSLRAAQHTVEPGRPAHSLHGYFMRPGDPKIPIVYEVIRDRDGGSFSTRRVVAVQHGVPIFSMSVSFHQVEEGFTHAVAMPVVPPPEKLVSEKQMLEASAHLMPENMRRYFERDRPIELRACDPSHYLAPKAGMPSEQNVWIRATGSLSDDPALHQCVLAYASDMTLLDTSLVPHGRNIFDQSLMMASLDHCLWFHDSFRADDWLLYAQDTPWAANARGFNRGLIFSRDGRLIASAAQEGLIRLKRKIKK